MIHVLILFSEACVYEGSTVKLCSESEKKERKLELGNWCFVKYFVSQKKWALKNTNKYIAM